MRNEIYDKPCPMITDMVTANIKSAEGVRTFILGDPLEAKLKRSDFEHVKGYETLSRLLGSVSQKKSLGVNFLIYGPAGTGKTEMSKTICSDLNLKLYGVSSRGRERDPEERRRDLARSLALIEGTENGALLVDECEDLWGGGGFHFQLFGLERSEPQKNGGKSKLFFHRLMETATVPVIWVCNQTQNVDKAHLRRFRYAVEMEKLSKETRMAIWNRCAENLNLHLPEERIKSLSEKYDIPPALMETAMANASDLGDDTIIEESLDSILSAMGQKVPNQCKESKKLPFAPELLNTSENLERLADSLVSKGIHRISLLLYGVSGSGKSAYAGYLAERLGIPFICKKASDILGPYVGQTEMNIAQTFQEARETKSLLCLDECDSWLRDRRSARQSWEIQAVNEMLTQMETFEGPFVCTTNLYEEIDPAAYRRFLRKVKYEFLESEQVEAAFRYFFGLEIPKPYNDLTALSPGDFVNVKKAATIYDITDPKELAELLRNEQNAKIQIESKRIGFAC